MFSLASISSPLPDKNTCLYTRHNLCIIEQRKVITWSKMPQFTVNDTNRTTSHPELRNMRFTKLTYRDSLSKDSEFGPQPSMLASAHRVDISERGWSIERGAWDHRSGRIADCTSSRAIWCGILDLDPSSAIMYRNPIGRCVKRLHVFSNKHR